MIIEMEINIVLILLLLLLFDTLFHIITTRRFIELKDFITKTVQPNFIKMGHAEQNLVELAISIWRIEKNMKDSDNSKLNLMFRNTKNQLQKMKIEISDFTDENYHSSMNLEIMNLSELDGLKEEKYLIIETLEPMITLKGVIINKAKVILAKKEESK